MGTIAPARMKASIRYQGNLAANTGAYTYWSNVYSLNSAYDPLYTVGGGSCTGYAQWIALYRYCRVTSVQIKYTVFNLHAVESGFLITMYAVPFASWQIGDSSSVPTLDLVKESTWSSFHDNFAGSHPSNPFTMVKSYNIADIEGTQLVPPIDYSSTVDTDPAKQVTVQVGIIATDGTTTGQTAFGTIEIQYQCEFYQRRVFSVT